MEEITVKFYENYSPSRAQRMTQVRAPKNDEIFLKGALYMVQPLILKKKIGLNGRNCLYLISYNRHNCSFDSDCLTDF